MTAEEMHDMFFRLMKDILPPIDNEKLSTLLVNVRQDTIFNFKIDVENILRPILLYNIVNIDDRFTDDVYTTLGLIGAPSGVMDWLEVMEKIVLPFIRESRVLDYE